MWGSERRQEDILQRTAHLRHCRSYTLVTHLPFKAYMYLSFIREIWFPSSGSQWLFKEKKARGQGTAHHSCLKYQELYLTAFIASFRLPAHAPTHPMSPQSQWRSATFLKFPFVSTVTLQHGSGNIPADPFYLSFPECAWLGSWFIKWGAANNNLVFWALSLPSWPAPVPVKPAPSPTDAWQGSSLLCTVWHLHHTLKWHDWKASSSATLSQGWLEKSDYVFIALK